MNLPFLLAAALCAAALLLPPEIHPAGRLVTDLLVAAAALVLGFAPVPGREEDAGPDGPDAALARGRSWGRAALLLAPLPVASLALAGGGHARGLDELAALAAFAVTVLLGRRVAADPGRARGLALLLAIGGAAVSIQAILQHHWAYPEAAAALRASQDPGADPFLVRLEAGRPAGPFSLPAALAGFLALSLPMTLALGRRSGAPAARAAWIAPGVLGILAILLGAQAYALFLTRSLGGLLAVTAALAMMAAPAADRRRVGRVLLVAALVFAAGAALFTYARRAEIGARPGGDPISLRLGNWRVAAEMIRDHPILGVGPGRFAVFYPRHQRPGMNETQFAHNSWLQLAATWGAWILAPLGLLAFAAVRPRGGRDPSAAGSMAGAAAAAGAGFLLHNVIDFTFFLPGVALPAGVLLGLGSCAPGSSRPRRPGAVTPVRRGRRAARLAAVAAAALFVVQAATADRSAWHLDQARAAALGGSTVDAEAEARAAASACPWDADPWAFLAQSLLARQAAGSGDEALRKEAAARAVRLEPEAAILHHTLALDRAASDDPAAAWVEETRAHRLNPDKPLYRPDGAAAR